jgi:hypothetical protein
MIRSILGLGIGISAFVLCIRSAPAQHHHDTHANLEIPRVIQLEHKDIHLQLSNVIDLGGATGAAAQEVADALHPHFEAEEEYAMPVLGILQPLANGTATSTQKKEALERSTKLRTNLPSMLSEHKEIVRKLDKLTSVALKENKPTAIEFVDRLKVHAEQEEQILYPSAMLVGDLLRQEKLQ